MSHDPDDGHPVSSLGMPAGAEHDDAAGHLKRHYDERRARLNCVSQILESIPYDDIVPEPVEIPDRLTPPYTRPPMADQTFVPERY